MPLSSVVTEPETSEIALKPRPALMQDMHDSLRLPFPLRLIPIAALLVAFLEATVPASAQMDDIHRADNGAGIELGGSYFDYAETYGGQTLDTEKGVLPAAGLDLGLLTVDQARIADLEDVYFHVDAGLTNGSTAYDGFLCNPFRCHPYQGTTKDGMTDWDVKLGRALPLADEFIVVPFAQIGHHDWSRDANGIGAFSELYSDWRPMAGTLVQLNPADGVVVSLTGAVGTTFDANMTSAGQNYPLKGALAWEVDGDVGYRLGDRIELTTGLGYGRFGYGASPIEGGGPTATFEPDSTTQSFKLDAGLSFLFF